MIYRPPPHSLKPFSAPPVMQYRIDASDDWQAQNGQVASVVADAIVQSYESSINQFINNQRQQSRLGIIEQQRHQMTLPGIVVDYGSNQGNETIRITVKPEYVNPLSLPFLIDINLDGYVAFVHNFNAGQPGFSPIPYDMLINGTVICTYYPQLSMLETPGTFSVNNDTAAVAVVVAFGPTALRCQSLHDKVNPFNPKSPQHVSNMPALMSQCQPARAKIKDSTGINGADIPAHADLLGYFIWGPPVETTPAAVNQGWGDPFNPDDYAYDGGGNIVFEDFTGYGASGYGSPVQLGTIVQYASAASSPLNSSGKNVFQVQPNPEGLVAGGVALQAAMIAAANATIAKGITGANNYTIDASDALQAAISMNNEVFDTTLQSAYNAEVACPTTVDKTNQVACLTAENLQNTAYTELFFCIAYAQNLANDYFPTNPIVSAAYAAAAVYAQTAATAAQRAAADAAAASNYEPGITALAAAESLTTAQLQAAAAENGLVEGQADVVLAEFYDRKSLRIGTASWNYASAPGGVLINDKPLYWNCDFNPTTLGGLDFDLTPAKTYPEASTLGEKSLRFPDTTVQTPSPPKGPQPKRTTYLNGVWTFGAYS